MIVPAAQQIYTAAALLKRREQNVKDDEADELLDAKETLVHEYGFPGVDVPSYLLGLEVARVILSGDVALAKAGIDPATLL